MKRFLSVFFSALLLIQAQFSGVFAKGPIKANSMKRVFLDVSPDHQYGASIQYLKDHDIVSGYQEEAVSTESEKTPFRPDFQLNRAELVKIMIESQVSDEEISSCTESSFPDVKTETWFTPYVCVAKKKGIVSGYPDGTFKPEQSVNFAEASKIIANATGLKKPGTRGDEVWFTPFVKSLSVRKAIPESIRSFGKKITRGEMARMIHAAKEEVEEEVVPFEELEKLNKKDDEVPQIEACDELIEKLELNQERRFMPFDVQGFERGIPTVESPKKLEESADDISDMEAGSDESAAGLEEKSKTSSEDYSSTNVQVKGVDEADIIKNDGKYIYLIKGNTVRIVNAFPGEKLEELKTLTLDDTTFYPKELYVDDNQMVIIGSSYTGRNYEYEPFIDANNTLESEGMAFMMPEFQSTRMKVYIFDIKDRRDPKMQRVLEIEGDYNTSRKVGKNVYFVLNQWIPEYYLPEENKEAADIILPRFKDSSIGEEERPLVSCSDVLYFPDATQRQYLITAGLNIASLESDLKRKVVIGFSQNIYASKENLYVASFQYGNFKRIMMREEGASQEAKTLIYRFKLAEDEIEYENQGTVPGNILNQFSMDESGDYFRIATTEDEWHPERGNIGANNLFILNKDRMETVGSIRDIAQGEKIKSVRFMGDRAYMVTFKNVDPLFVMDLTNPENPKILGELKIPGWSDYLHPYDDTHLIGFGREVDPKAEEEEFLTPDMLLGMKLSLFDVSDVSNPKEMFKEVIGSRGTTSELLTNHKALLFDREKKLLAFPITMTTLYTDAMAATSPEDLKFPEPTLVMKFAGGMVYTVDLENGFTLRGTVSHFTPEEEAEFLFSGEYFSGDYGKLIKRLLFIGKYLYGVSENHVSASSLDKIKQIKRIELDTMDDPVPMGKIPDSTKTLPVPIDLE